MTMLRITGLVWYTDGPLGVVEAHSVQSSNDIRCRDLFQNKFFSSISFLKYSVSWYHRITEHCIINRLYYFLRFHHEYPPGSLFLPANCSNYCQQSTRISKSWTTRPPTPFSYPPPLLTLCLIDFDEKIHFCFLTEIQSHVIRKFRRQGRRVICRRDRLVKLYFTGKSEWPTSSIVQVMSKTKKSAKKR